jgi:hypothetical protein
LTGWTVLKDEKMKIHIVWGKTDYESSDLLKAFVKYEDADSYKESCFTTRDLEPVLVGEEYEKWSKEWDEWKESWPDNYSHHHTFEIQEQEVTE